MTVAVVDAFIGHYHDPQEVGLVYAFLSLSLDVIPMLYLTIETTAYSVQI